LGRPPPEGRTRRPPRPGWPGRCRCPARRRRRARSGRPAGPPSRRRRWWPPTPPWPGRPSGPRPAGARGRAWPGHGAAAWVTPSRVTDFRPPLHREGQVGSSCPRVLGGPWGAEPPTLCPIDLHGGADGKLGEPAVHGGGGDADAAVAGRERRGRGGAGGGGGRGEVGRGGRE